MFFSGIQAVEAKAEWNFMKLSRLIKSCAFNPSLIAVRGLFVKLQRAAIPMATKFYTVVINFLEIISYATKPISSILKRAHYQPLLS